MVFILSLLILTGASFLAPTIARILPKQVGGILAIAPAVVFGLFAAQVSGVSSGEAIKQSYEWFPGLGVDLAFHLDGLALMMALLITGIGTFIVWYAGGYLKGDRLLGRFLAYLLAFMGAMLGLVLVDNIYLMFIFWELTSITSYLLIGYFHEEEESRWKALQALLVTGTGGMAMFAGFILAANVTGTTVISEMIGQGALLQGHAHYVAIAILFILGAFTKSAQFPFHFWLPNAMAAPTPVSAFLHSATMVKAGVFLLARMNPALGGTDLWMYTLGTAGALTFLVGGMNGLVQTDVKRILAYSTLCILGVLVMLIGLGSDYALKAMVLLLVAHALYKACLFMVGGAIDHETGTREITILSGLRKTMPITAIAAGVAAFSNAGLPPLFGFIGKEYFYEAAWHSEPYTILVTGVALLGNIMLFVLACHIGYHVFWGKESKDLPKKPHEAPISMWAGPIVLAMLSLAAGIYPGLLADGILKPALDSVAGKDIELHLALWHGVTPALILSMTTVVCGLILFRFRWALWAKKEAVLKIRHLGMEAMYERIYNGTLALARWQTVTIQNGLLPRYVMLTVLSVGGLMAFKLFTTSGIMPDSWAITSVELLPAGIAILMMGAAIFAAFTNDKVTALVALGAVGFGVTPLFLYFGAPDLAITQLCVDTLSVILFMLVLNKLPEMKRKSSKGVLFRDILIAGAFGLLMAFISFQALSTQLAPSIAEDLGQMSYLEAHGRNVVNVILVDFRGLDTFGEITVLAIASLGISALILALKAKPGEDQ